MSFVRLVLCCSPLFLTACGEGWEAQRTTEYFPYGNQRTAGSGVVYVRAKMLPEKELKAEPICEKAEEPVPALSGDKIFSDAQVKGAAPPPPAKAEAAVKEEPVAAKVEEAKPAEAVAVEPPKTEEVKPAEVKPEEAKPAEVKEDGAEKQGSLITPVKPKDSPGMKLSAVSPAADVQTETVVVTEHRHPQEGQVAVTALKTEVGEQATTQIEDAGVAYEIYPNEVIQPTHSVSMPKDEIVLPKKDFIGITSEGQKSLNQIYEDAF